MAAAKLNSHCIIYLFQCVELSSLLQLRLVCRGFFEFSYHAAVYCCHQYKICPKSTETLDNYYFQRLAKIFPHLRWFSISWPYHHLLNSSSLAQLLTYFPRLQSLELSGCIQIDDSSLELLRQRYNYANCAATFKFSLQNLRFLSLASCKRITNHAILSSLCAINSLTVLNLSETNLHTESMTGLGEMSNITWLSLRNCTFLDDSSISTLFNCPEPINFLTYDETFLISLRKQLNPISTSIKHLDLYNCAKLTTLSLQIIEFVAFLLSNSDRKGCCTCQQSNLHSKSSLLHPWDEFGIEFPAAKPKRSLISPEFRDNVEGEGWNYPQNSENCLESSFLLESLNFSINGLAESTKANDKIAIELIHLQNFMVSKCFCLDFIPKLPSLKSLCIADMVSPINPHLSLFCSVCSEIEALNLSSNPGVNDLSLEIVAKLCNLSSLDVSRCSKITSAGLKPLIERQKLTQLDLQYCTTIDYEGILSLMHIKGLKLLKLRGILSNLSDTIQYYQQMKPQCLVVGNN
jgi:F-box/leucine-rich repeat protein 14